MKFRMAFFLTNLHVAIKVFSGIVVNKVLSIYLGPSGVALYGQFQSTAAVITGLAHGSIQTGTVKLVSRSKKNGEEIQRILSTSFAMTLTFSVAISVLVFVLSDVLGQFVFGAEKDGYIFKAFSGSILFYSINIYLLSILTGLERVRIFTTINMFLSIVTLASVSLLTYFYELDGAIFALFLSQIIVMIFSIYIVRKTFATSQLSLLDLKEKWSAVVASKLLRFALATFSSGAMVSLSMIILRNIIIEEISLDSAGIWESGRRILVYFNMIFAVPFGLYYFPKFSNSVDAVKVRKLLYESLIFNLPLMLALGAAIVIFKSEMIRLLFSKDFLGLSDFLNYILLAEILRIAGSFIHNIYLSQSMILITILFQLLFFVVFITLSYATISSLGLVGVGLSYLGSAMLYLVSYIIYFNVVCPFSIEKSVPNA